MTRSDSLAQQIALCRAGDPAAIEWLVRAHQAAVYRVALSILDDPAEADEATQETFLAALRRVDTYRGEASLMTWLYAITVNVSRTRLRKQQTRQRLGRLLSLARLTSSDPPAASAPETAAIQRETTDTVWNAVQALGEKHRLPVILRYYHDLSTAEIAQVLGLSEGTVHSRLSTARDRLRVAMRAEQTLQPKTKAL